MGYLLGAPPPGTGAGRMTEASPILRRWVAVNRVDQQPAYLDSIVGFAIDSPRVGDRTYGQGVEINGWVLAHEPSLQGVRTVFNGVAGAIHRLDVRRPDVAADYDAVAHAEDAGFSFWVPFGDSEGAWHIAVDAVLAGGVVVQLAELRGTTGSEERIVPPGLRQLLAPDFVIIGAQRGGTTSLHTYLSAHPQIQTAPTKELHYFTDRFARGRDWYLGQFPRDLPAGTLTGEASPYALFHPLAPRRLHETAPEAKLIVLLRNPIDRAYSHYLLERARGDEPFDFSSALDAEAVRLAGEEAALMANPDYHSDPHKHFSYVARGDYASQLERWFALFPSRQLLILRSEDFYARTAGSLARVEAFLEIAPGTDVPYVAHNRSDGPALAPAMRDRLGEHFAPRNARLAELLGWDPGWD
ncbi:MAG: sulfotransferase domain-containing protein [Chloroflexia bacterium]|nr:sulfotransferase domain-containing protein [Chloroflexia bacterium]